MSEVNNGLPELPFVRELCRDLANEDVQEAEANVWRLVSTVRKIHEHVQSRSHARCEDGSQTR